VNTAVTCTSCSGPYYLNGQTQRCLLECPAPYVGNNGTLTCDNSCAQSNQYFDPADKRICKTCNNNCLTCVNTDIECVTCAAPLFRDPTSKTCVIQCPIWKWGNNGTRTCDNSCANPGEYGDVTDNRICKKCDPNCLTCVDTAVKCLSCSVPFYLEAERCVTTCSNLNWGNNSTRTCDAACSLTNQYGDPVDRICKQCNTFCKTCSVTASNCLSCETPLFLNSNDQTCVETCPNGLWGNNNTRTCDASCSSTDQFGDEANKRICTVCDPNCKTCQGKIFIKFYC
jgi:proprotein convertase subtilisin/kexin type 5